MLAQFTRKREFRKQAQFSLSLCGFLALTAVAFCQGTPTPSSNTVQSHSAHHVKAKEIIPPKPDPTVPVPAVAPNLLDQPALPATVSSANNELTVKANNSSLTQILRQVSSKTGMKLDGLGGDERVFGSFGPGSPREVLTALLNGTSYNVVMIGDLPNGAPRELMLMHRAGGGAGTAAPMNQTQNPTPNQNQSSDQAAQNGQNGDDATQDDNSNNGDDSSDDAPPMQYTPPSIAPAEPTPTNPGEGAPPNPQAIRPTTPNAPE